MYVDSHCHLDFPELHARLPEIVSAMKEAMVSHALCVAVSLEAIEGVLQIARDHDHIYASVGVHPDYQDCTEPSVEALCELAADPKVVAIGETGLDYFRTEGDVSWQQERFRTHIRAARELGNPLIIHTREAGQDTIDLLREEGAAEVGGVMHCYTDSWEVARQALDLGFHISFSGIITFKNAHSVREVAAKVPLDRLLIETDAPFLAPVPHRGKTNEPAYVIEVAETLGKLHGLSREELGQRTSDNFSKLFGIKCH